MKNLCRLDEFRVEHPLGGLGDDSNGAFKVFIKGKSFFCIASSGGGWEHVSVSPCHQKRCPTWDEMCAIKAMFFEPEECVVEYHPPRSSYVNNYPFCLHLWRPLRAKIPVPPIYMV